MKTIISKNLQDTFEIAKEWYENLNANENEAVIVGLYGNLGSGKTTLTQSLAKYLNIKDSITSPTFVIEKIYKIENSKFKNLIHIDAYRLESGRELQNLDFEKIVEDKDNLIIIEWPENVKEILPENHIKIQCEFIDENTRKYII